MLGRQVEAELLKAGTRVNVTVNDEEVQVEEGITVSALLDNMGLPGRGVAVAVSVTE